MKRAGATAHGAGEASMLVRARDRDWWEEKQVVLISDAAGYQTSDQGVRDQWECWAVLFEAADGEYCDTCGSVLFILSCRRRDEDLGGHRG
jgi:hypothetical protein